MKAFYWETKQGWKIYNKLQEAAANESLDDKLRFVAEALLADGHPLYIKDERLLYGTLHIYYNRLNNLTFHNYEIEIRRGVTTSSFLLTIKLTIMKNLAY